MGDSSIQFHKIWIDQCEATEGIRERFGLEDALHYLIGEKLFSFVHASEEDPDFAAELPAFVAEIRRLFSTKEIADFLDQLERSKFLAPQTLDPNLMISTTIWKMSPGLRIPSWVRKNCFDSPAFANCCRNRDHGEIQERSHSRESNLRRRDC